jgi:hypothetical protein
MFVLRVDIHFSMLFSWIFGAVSAFCIKKRILGKLLQKWYNNQQKNGRSFYEKYAGF